MNTSVEANRKKITTVIACLSAVAIILWFCFFTWMLTKNTKPSEYQNYNGAWQVSLNGKTLDYQENLASYKFSGLQIGDQVVLSTQLPKDLPLHRTMVMLFYLSTVDVKLDGQTIYSYGQEYAKKNWLVGSGYHFIDLPESAVGKTLTIYLEVREKDAFTNITTPRIAPTNTAYLDYANEHIVSAFVGIFLILVGVCLTMVSGVAYCYNKVFSRLLYIGIFSFFMGIWSVCNMKVLQIFKVDMAASTTMEYLTLYLAPVTFVLMVAQLREKDALWKKQLVNAVAIFLFIFAVVSSVLHFLNIEHFPRMLTYFHLFGGASLVLVVISGFGRKDKPDKTEISINIGIIALFVSVGFDLVRFNLQKYVMQDNELLTISVIPVGTLIFIICLIVSYIFYVYGIIVNEAEQQWLTERAYHDELCKTYNRTKCNEIFAQFDASSEEYALINMDINGLKELNDTFGHTKGDLLLSAFAGILMEAFSGVGDVFRMGGDEFLIIVRKDKFSQIDVSLEKMVRLEKRRSQDLDIPIEAAYGIARREECPEDLVQKVYALADSRMYEMKTKQKINKHLH